MSHEEKPRKSDAEVCANCRYSKPSFNLFWCEERGRYVNCHDLCIDFRPKNEKIADKIYKDKRGY